MIAPRRIRTEKTGEGVQVLLSPMTKTAAQPRPTRTPASGTGVAVGCGVGVSSPEVILMLANLTGMVLSKPFCCAMTWMKFQA